MDTTQDKRAYLLEGLADKESRDASVAANLSNAIAFQIRAMREHRGWTQDELGERADMVQEAISKLEDPNYGRFTIKTLRKLASAFDVSLIVRFAPFSELVDWVTELSPDDLAVPCFDEDVLQPSSPTSQYMLAVRIDPGVLRFGGVSGQPSKVENVVSFERYRSEHAISTSVHTVA